MNHLFSIFSIFLNIGSWIWYIHAQFHSQHKTSPSLWLASFISMTGDFSLLGFLVDLYNRLHLVLASFFVEYYYLSYW
jgi:hypothetical protein